MITNQISDPNLLVTFIQYIFIINSIKNNEFNKKKIKNNCYNHRGINHGGEFNWWIGSSDRGQVAIEQDAVDDFKVFRSIDNTPRCHIPSIPRLPMTSQPEAAKTSL